MADENGTRGQNVNERSAGDATSPPVRTYQLPKHLGRYYRMLLGCCVAGMFFIVLGVVGLLAWAAAAAYAIICLVTSLTALVRIRRSGGTLQGNGYVIPSILLPLIIILWLFSFQVAFYIGMQSMMWQVHLFRIRQLGKVLMQYRNEHGGSTPPGEQWCDILKNANEQAIYSFEKSKEGSYTSNLALNVRATEVVGELPDDLVLLFETEPGWNQVGGLELLAHGDKDDIVHVCLAGNEAKLVRRSNAANLRWTVEGEPAAAGMPVGGYWVAGAAVAVLCGGILLALRKYVRTFGLAALGVGVLSAIAGVVCGFVAERLYSVYSLREMSGVGATAGGLVGFLAGVCFVLVLGYARDRMRAGISMVGFATVAGAITGIAASTAVHVFLMIGYNEFYWLYPAAGASFGIWAGIVLGWIGSGLVRPTKAAAVAECAP